MLDSRYLNLGVVLLTAAFAALIADPVSAQCSTITGPGMSGGGPCPQPRRIAPPPQANQRSGAYSPGYNSGSGQAAAGFAGAGLALGILGSMMEEAENQATAERANAAAAADEAAHRAPAELRVYCDRTFDQAWNLVRDASEMSRDDPSGAIRLFEQVRTVFQRCSNPASRELVRDRIREAQRRLAAVAEDNRVAVAKRQFGANNIYAGSNPFEGPAKSVAQPSQPKPAAIVLSITPQDVFAKAQSRCAYAAEKPDEMKACMQTQEAIAITQAEPSIKQQCVGAKDASARETCSIRAYLQKAQQAAANPSGQDNCYFDVRGRPCYPGGGSAAAPGPQKVSLRDELKRKLEEQRKKEGRDKVSDAEVDTALKLAGGGQTAATIEPHKAPPPGSEDDPLQHYLRSTNRSTNGRNDGVLGPSAR